MSHYHLATVVKFQADHRSVNTDKNLFGCLYEIKKDDRVEHPIEKFLILSVDGTFNDSEPKEYIITDFLYKEGGSDSIRCRVLCPIVTTKHHLPGKDFSPNIHWLEVTDNPDNFILTPSRTCSPKNYAYGDSQSLFSAFKISEENYVPMYCFSDISSTHLNSYLAFCQVVDLTDVDKEWEHRDELHFATNSGGLEFLCHKQANPY
jgi:hypothetical protein